LYNLHVNLKFNILILFRLLVNVTKKLKSMSESELVSKLLEASPRTSNINNEPEDMHIDILQVHDTVGNENDPTAIGFSCKDDSCNSLPTIPIASDLTPDLLQGDLQTPPGTSNNPRDPFDLLWWRESINLDNTDLILMGFSKGCVVLNQVSLNLSNEDYVINVGFFSILVYL
jgi:hypothetical protein